MTRPSTPEGSAQRTFARLLRTAFGDDPAAREILDGALVAASLRDVPEALPAMLEFLRLHLGPRMRERVGPRLVAALIDDLEAEIEHERSHGDSSSSRMAVATRTPPKPVEGEPPRAEPKLTAPPAASGFDAFELDAMAEAPFEDAPSSVVPRAARSAPQARAPIVRPRVLLIDPDRFGRSSLARALVCNSCDVTVLDDAAAAMLQLRDLSAPHVIVTEVAGLDIESLLGALRRGLPDVPLIAWTRMPRANVELLMRTAGFAAFEIVPKSGRAADVVATVQRLVLGG